MNSSPRLTDSDVGGCTSDVKSEDINHEMALLEEEDTIFSEDQLKTLNQLNRVDDDDDDENFDEHSPPQSPSFEMHDSFGEYHSEEFVPPSPLPVLFPCLQNQPYLKENLEYPEKEKTDFTPAIGSNRFLVSTSSASGPVTPDNVVTDSRRFSGKSTKNGVKRRSREEMKAMTPAERLNYRREKNKRCSETYRANENRRAKELVNQKESLIQEDEELHQANELLEVEYTKHFGDLQKLKDSLKTPVMKASKKERQLLEEKIQYKNKELDAIAARKAELDKVPPKSTNASRKCRKTKKLKNAKNELAIHDLKVSIEVQKLIRVEIEKALGFETPPGLPPVFASDEQPIPPPHPKRRPRRTPTSMPHGDRTPKDLEFDPGNDDDPDLMDSPSEDFLENVMKTSDPATLESEGNISQKDPIEGKFDENWDMIEYTKSDTEDSIGEENETPPSPRTTTTAQTIFNRFPKTGLKGTTETAELLALMKIDVDGKKDESGRMIEPPRPSDDFGDSRKNLAPPPTRGTAPHHFGKVGFPTMIAPPTAAASRLCYLPGPTKTNWTASTKVPTDRFGRPPRPVWSPLASLATATSPGANDQPLHMKALWASTPASPIRNFKPSRQLTFTTAASTGHHRSTALGCTTPKDISCTPKSGRKRKINTRDPSERHPAHSSPKGLQG